MEQTLIKLGINKKEAKLYLFLIESKPSTASVIAQAINETRTNTYMLLQGLSDKGLIHEDDLKKIKTYSAVAPVKLKELLVKQQQGIRQSQIELNSILPQLTSVFNLRHHRPGVVYFEGLEGFAQYQDDVSYAKRIDIIGSNVVPEYPEAWEILSEGVKKRYANGTIARLLFHEDARNWLDMEHYTKERGFEVRFWGDQPFEADIILYDDKIGLTSYEQALITTVISNRVITDTFRVVFENIWQSALTPKQ